MRRRFANAVMARLQLEGLYACASLRSSEDGDDDANDPFTLDDTDK